MTSTMNKSGKMTSELRVTGMMTMMMTTTTMMMVVMVMMAAVMRHMVVPTTAVGDADAATLLKCAIPLELVALRMKIPAPFANLPRIASSTMEG